MSECERLEEYLDRTLTDAERAEMDRHVESCADCRAAGDEDRRLRQLALDLPPVEVPADLGDRIRERLASETPSRRRPARVLRPFAFIATAAAAVLVAVLVRPADELPPPKGPTLEPIFVTEAGPADLGATVSDWLVQVGNAPESDVGRLREEAREQRLLSRVRAALPAAQGTADGVYLTAVSDLLVQLENGDQAERGNGPGFLSEEARLVARLDSRLRGMR